MKAKTTFSAFWSSHQTHSLQSRPYFPIQHTSLLSWYFFFYSQQPRMSDIPEMRNRGKVSQPHMMILGWLLSPPWYQLTENMTNMYTEYDYWVYCLQCDPYERNTQSHLVMIIPYELWNWVNHIFHSTFCYISEIGLLGKSVVYVYSFSVSYNTYFLYLVCI